MATRETISKLVLYAEAKGFDAAAKKIQELANNTGNVTKATEQEARGFIAAEAAAKKLERSLDASAASAKRYADVQARIARDVAAGYTTQARANELLALAEQKHRRAATGATEQAAAYGRLSASMGSMLPMFDKFGVGATVGMIGGGRFAGIAAGIGAVVGASAGIVTAGDAWTQYENRLKAAGVATGDLQARTGQLADIAERSRAQLEPTVSLYASLAQATQTLGVSQKDLATATETINKAFALNGTSAAQASGAMLQLAQAMQSGTLRGDELNSVLEGAPPLARLIAKEFKVGVGELRGLAEAGKLTADRVFGAIVKGAAGVNAEFAKLTPSVEGSLTNLGTGFSRLGNAINDTLGLSTGVASFFDTVAKGAGVAANAINAYNAAADRAAKERAAAAPQTESAGMARRRAVQLGDGGAPATDSPGDFAKGGIAGGVSSIAAYNEQAARTGLIATDAAAKIRIFAGGIEMTGAAAAKAKKEQEEYNEALRLARGDLTPHEQRMRALQEEVAAFERAADEAKEYSEALRLSRGELTGHESRMKALEDEIKRREQLADVAKETEGVYRDLEAAQAEANGASAGEVAALQARNSLVEKGLDLTSEQAQAYMRAAEAAGQIAANLRAGAQAQANFAELDVQKFEAAGGNPADAAVRRAENELLSQGVDLRSQEAAAFLVSERALAAHAEDTRSAAQATEALQRRFVEAGGAIQQLVDGTKVFLRSTNIGGPGGPGAGSIGRGPLGTSMSNDWSAASRFNGNFYNVPKGAVMRGSGSARSGVMVTFEHTDIKNTPGPLSNPADRARAAASLQDRQEAFRIRGLEMQRDSLDAVRQALDTLKGLNAPTKPSDARRTVDPSAYNAESNDAFFYDPQSREGFLEKLGLDMRSDAQKQYELDMQAFNLERENAERTLEQLGYNRTTAEAAVAQLSATERLIEELQRAAERRAYEEEAKAIAGDQAKLTPALQPQSFSRMSGFEASLASRRAATWAGGFAEGGEFTVRGRPGRDQNLVSMALSDNEKVKITPAGKSERQPPVFNQTFNIYAQDAQGVIKSRGEIARAMGALAGRA